VTGAALASLPRLHAVLDDAVIARAGVPERAAAMARSAGPALAVHLRARTLEGRAFLELARQLLAAIRSHGAWLIVNGRADVARAVDARAVVSGRGGLAVADVRRVAPVALVGRSVHDGAEARRAAAEDPDFLVAGAVFATPSHPHAEPAGLPLIAAAAALGRPVIAIGGVTAERTGELVEAGAWGVAAVRALWDAPDPGAAAAAFVAALSGVATVAVTLNGERRRVKAGLSLSQLLAALDLDPRAVVVEHNRRIVRRDGLAATSVADGDAIELVHFVGGG
jgi:thiamine-phosphate pyrophosphorylase